MRVIGAVERRVATGRQRSASELTTRFFSAPPAGSESGPRELPDFLPRVGVDDPAGIEIAVLACLANRIHLDLGGRAERESGLLQLLFRGRAQIDDGAGGERGVGLGKIGVGQDRALAMNLQVERVDGSKIAPIPQAIHQASFLGLVVRPGGGWVEGVERFVGAGGQRTVPLKTRVSELPRVVAVALRSHTTARVRRSMIQAFAAHGSSGRLPSHIALSIVSVAVLIWQPRDQRRRSAGIAAEGSWNACDLS